MAARTEKKAVKKAGKKVSTKKTAKKAVAKRSAKKVDAAVAAPVSYDSTVSSLTARAKEFGGRLKSFSPGKTGRLEYFVKMPDKYVIHKVFGGSVSLLFKVSKTGKVKACAEFAITSPLHPELFRATPYTNGKELRTAVEKMGASMGFPAKATKKINKFFDAV